MTSRPPSPPAPSPSTDELLDRLVRLLAEQAVDEHLAIEARCSAAKAQERASPGEWLTILRSHLDQIGSGVLSAKATNEATGLLYTFWNRFEGCDAEGMKADQLLYRTKSMEWSAPLLSFELEREARGSADARTQRWVIDLAGGRASFCVAGKRRRAAASAARWRPHKASR